MNSKFNVFHCGYFPSFGEIYAVVTGEKKGNEIITEWFYLIKSKPKKINGFILKANGLFPSIEEFWNSETYIHLKNALFYDHIWPSIKDKSDFYLYEKEINLNPIDRHSLFSINSEYPDFIKYINRNTSCTSFMEFVKLLNVIVINRTPIPYSDED